MECNAPMENELRAVGNGMVWQCQGDEMLRAYVPLDG